MKKTLTLMTVFVSVATLPIHAVAATAEFVAFDKATSGDWYAYDYDSFSYEYAYGRIGYLIANNGAGIPLIPPGFGIAIGGNAQVYGGTTPAERLLLNPANPAQRISGIWYKASDSIDVTVTTPSPTRVALYAYGYDGGAALFTVTASNTVTGATETQATPFETLGTYMVWLVDGTAVLRVSSSGTSARPFLMGVFMDPPLPAFKDEGVANVEEDAGVWSAEIFGRLLSPAGAGTAVYVCWGASDEGTDFDEWEHQEPVTASFPEAFSLPLDGLLASNDYYYNIMVSNAYGVAWAYADNCPQIALGRPLVATMAADRVGAFSARLQGILNSFAPAAVDFLWWADASTVTNVIAIGTQESGMLEAYMGGLAKETLYHFQIQAENEYGLALSDVASFTTVAPVAGDPYVTTKAGVWHDPTVWDMGNVPPDGANATVNHALTLTWPTFSLDSLTINAAFTFTRWDAAVMAKDVEVNSTVTHWPQSATPGAVEWVADQRVWIVCDNLTVTSPHGWIDANGKGYGKLCGPGHVPYSGAVHGYCSAGHGGRGNGGRNSVTYGDALAPVEPGSGGSNTSATSAGSGGGVVRIEATGTVTVDGQISANGGVGVGAWADLGSGGSVYITCKTVSGGGWIRANGAGNFQNYGAAGGGRVAVVYDPEAQALIAPPTLRLAAAGGSNLHPGNILEGMHGRGEPGTVYVSDFSFFPQEDIAEGFQLVFPDGITEWNPASLTLRNTWVIIDGGGSKHLSGDFALLGDHARFDFTNATLSCANLTMTGRSLLNVAAGATNGIVEYGALVAVGGTLSIGENSILRVKSHPANGGSVKITAKNAVIASNGAIDAWGQGFAAGDTANPQGYGPGRPPHPSGTGLAGASHGGRGGFKVEQNPAFAPADPYGDEQRPRLPGSSTGATAGTPGDPGGGVIWLEVDNLFTFHGRLRASGGVERFIGASVPHANTSGAAGGSIYVRCKTFEGEGGTFEANGSAGGNSTLISGGGGRIALWRLRDHYAWEPGGWEEGVTLRANADPTGYGAGFSVFPRAENGTVFVGDIAEAGTTIIVR